jgi:hypothetical protein
MKKLGILFCLFCIINFLSISQEKVNYEKYGKIIKFELHSSMFPHSERMDGHKYDGQNYSFLEHYNDSTVLIFIPSDFKPSKKIDFVVHFHGWRNTVDSVVAQYNLIQQFSASKKNAILIIPQGPKNSPDSFGGKLEEKDGFKKFMSEIAKNLVDKNILPEFDIGNIILSGHSGAFRVISFIIQKGGLTKNISEVFLFDALYAQTEKYAYWIDHYEGKMINIYTNDGGTKAETEGLINDLQDWGFEFLSKEEKDINSQDLKKNRLIFIHSELEHNQVLYKNDNFLNYLSASCLK